MDKRRGWPVPDAVKLKPHIFALDEALQCEQLFRPNVLTITEKDYRNGEVTIEARNGAVKELRYLRVWLNLSRSVLFHAISYLDMFLSRMKVQERYLKCLTLSCLQLAANQLDHPAIDLDRLVKITRCRCTPRDVLRMADIVQDKIEITTKPITPLDFLNIYVDVFIIITETWEHNINKQWDRMREEMAVMLEQLLVNSNTAFLKSSMLALIVFQIEVENVMGKELPGRSVYYTLGEVLQFWGFVNRVQRLCKFKDCELRTAFKNFFSVLNDYEGGIQKCSRPQRKIRRNVSYYTPIKE